MNIFFLCIAMLCIFLVRPGDVISCASRSDVSDVSAYSVDEKVLTTYEKLRELLTLQEDLGRKLAFLEIKIRDHARKQKRKTIQENLLDLDNAEKALLAFLDKNLVYREFEV